MELSEYNMPESNKVFTEADFDGSRPAPLRLIGATKDRSAIKRQDILIDNLARATKQELSGVVSDDVVSFVSNGIVSRMHMREAMNSISYNNRLYRLPNPWKVQGRSWPEVLEASRETVKGTASVVQLDMAQRALGMASIVYRDLTMIGEFRRELEMPMWDEMSDFLGVDARHDADQTYRVGLFGFSDDILKSDEVGAMRIELKRTIAGGKLDNGTVPKVRTTVSVNTSKSSGYDQDVIESLRQQQLEAHLQDKKTDLSTNPQFLASVRYLIGNELPSGIILARNETIYGSNAELEAKTRLRNQRRRAIKAMLRGRKSI